jgi:NADPH2 dehydrogenase
MVVVGRPGFEQIASASDPVTAGRVQHYAARAAGGTGLVIVEATAVEPQGRCWAGGLDAWAPEHAPGLARLAEAIRTAGAVPAVQLVHGGPQSSPRIVKERLAPSAYEEGLHALTPEEIRRIQDHFAAAAIRAVEAGFDGVELHGAHGFLLDSFLSPERNHRTDQYGGAAQNRVRMLAETLAHVRAQLSPHALVWARLSVFNHVEEGFTADDLREVVVAVEAAGADLIHLSTRGALQPCFGEDRTLGQWVRGFTELPLIVAGGLGDPHDAERLVAEGHGDLAAVGSAMLEDPDWSAHAHEVLTD